MISLDQIQMLERKVESAVAKIAALQDLNSALRDKNTELEHTNSMLTQRISSFEADQGRIEQRRQSRLVPFIGLRKRN